MTNILLTSCYFFPFEFTFLPGLNTKMMLAAVGGLLMLYHLIRMRSIIFSKEIMISSLIAMVFSVIGLFAVDYNNSQDYSYASYIVSMVTWLAASYTTCISIAWIHGKLSPRLLINYLVAVCLLQCALALLIEFVPAVKIFVDSYFSIGITEFLNKVKRLYGIGAALDVAGVRFSAVLLMIAVLLAKDETIRHNSRAITVYVISFLLIAGIGNMIARTTLLGMVGGIVYLLSTTGCFSRTMQHANIKLWGIILSALAVVFIIGAYYYNTDAAMHKLLRFGFEGFFSWAETGEWRTDSTDKLNTTMWIWPEVNDTKTWLIGKAVFSQWHDVGTDIGYCRFIFYSGATGLVTFIIFFAYLSVTMAQKSTVFKHLFILLFLLLLVNWFKVSTDIYVIYALFLSMESPYLSQHYKEEIEHTKEKRNENSLLYIRPI
ncbi:hypothetical protein RYH73_09285 [Olivibacter sp. CPCC 100613]